MDGYRHRPAAPELDGPTAEALEAELAVLPHLPSGDLEPDPDAVAAYEEVPQAQADLESVTALQPAPVRMPGHAPAGTSELRRLADALAEPLPDTSQAPAAAAGGHSPSGNQQRSRLPRGVGIGVAVILMLAGIVAGVAARQPLGWAAAGAGAVIGAAVIVSILRDRSRQIGVLQELQAAGPAQAARAAAGERRAEAQRRAEALGLPADPAALRELADTADRASAAAGQQAGWERRRATAAGIVQEAQARLRATLSTRGAPATGDLGHDFGRYRECAQRQRLAAQAGRRHDLEARLASRRQAEAQAADTVRRRSGAEQELRASASDCGVSEAAAADPGVVAAALENWLRRRQQALGQRQQATGDYAVLRKLLEGRTLAEVQDEAARLAALADAAAHNLDPAQVTAADLGRAAAETLQSLRDEAQQARDYLTELRTTEDERQRVVPSVAASQEAAARAAERAGQLERLGRILASTQEFLTLAQESVHRSIAPQLADAIAARLTAVTDGRYTDVRVDPGDLQVRVRPPSGTWREAASRSHGTAEQVYLLLRAALAQYLVTTSETCPLILDDPTAHADTTRTPAVLEVLHTISAERQVVLFTHDTQVLAWAHGALAGRRDKVIELAGRIPV